MLLSTKQYAELIGVSQRTVQRWIQEGQLEATKIGKGYRIESDVNPQPQTELAPIQKPVPSIVEGADRYTTAEFAAIEGVSQRTIQRRIASGQYNAVREGKRWIILVTPETTQPRELPETFDDSPEEELYPITNEETLDRSLLRREFGSLEGAQNYLDKIPLPLGIKYIIKNQAGLFRVIVDYDVLTDPIEEQIEIDEESE